MDTKSTKKSLERIKFYLTQKISVSLRKSEKRFAFSKTQFYFLLVKF